MIDDKITIAYAYGPQNAGDFSLNLGTISLLSEIYDKKNFYMISRFGEDSPDFKESKKMLTKYEPDVSLIPCFFDVDRYRQTRFQRSLNMGKAAAEYIHYTKMPGAGINSDSPAVKAINESEFVFCNSGNLFYWNEYRRRDLAYLYGIVFPFKYAQRIEKPYGFLPQSIGDIQGLGKLLMKDLFEKAQFFTFREPISKEKFLETFGEEHPVFLDTAFFIDSFEHDIAKEILDEVDLDENNFISITIRTAKLGDVGSLEEEKQSDIIQKLQKLIDHNLSEYDHDVLLVCQTKKDRDSTRLLKLIYEDEHRVKIIEEYDPVVLRSIYRHSIFLIAMRLHSAIFSLSAGTPVIGLYKEEWGPKMPGTLKLLDLEDSVFEISSFNLEDIYAQVDTMIEENEKLREKIFKNIKKIKRELVDYLKQ